MRNILISLVVAAILLTTGVEIYWESEVRAQSIGVGVLATNTDTHRTGYGSKPLYASVDTTIISLDTRFVDFASDTVDVLNMHLIADTSAGNNSARCPRIIVEAATRQYIRVTGFSWDQTGPYYTALDTGLITTGKSTSQTVNSFQIDLAPTRFARIRIRQVLPTTPAATDTGGIVAFTWVIEAPMLNESP